MQFSEFGYDFRSSMRSLLRSPGFAIVVILTLTLGIGAKTAIFSIVNGVILRPFSYPKPDQLMYLTTQFPGQRFNQTNLPLTSLAPAVERIVRETDSSVP